MKDTYPNQLERDFRELANYADHFIFKPRSGLTEMSYILTKNLKEVVEKSHLKHKTHRCFGFDQCFKQDVDKFYHIYFTLSTNMEDLKYVIYSANYKIGGKNFFKDSCIYNGKVTCLDFEQKSVDVALKEVKNKYLVRFMVDNINNFK